MMFETLESRMMLSTTVPAASVSFSSGNLTITGTSYTDTIKITESSGSVTVVSESKTLGTFVGVKLTTIKGMGAADTITYAGNTEGAAIYAGNGNDTINVSDPPVATGSSMPYSVIYDGTGSSKIYVNSGVNTTVYAQTGADSVYVKGGTNVRVFGHSTGSTRYDTISVSSYASHTTVYKDSLDKLSNSSSTTLIVAI